MSVFENVGSKLLSFFLKSHQIIFIKKFLSLVFYKIDSF
jgi:hypothetical protein